MTKRTSLLHYCLGIGYVVIVEGRTDRSLQGNANPSPLILSSQRDSILWSEVVDVARGELVVLAETKVTGRPFFLKRNEVHVRSRYAAQA